MHVVQVHSPVGLRPCLPPPPRAFSAVAFFYHDGPLLRRVVAECPSAGQAAAAAAAASDALARCCGPTFSLLLRLALSAQATALPNTYLTCLIHLTLSLLCSGRRVASGEELVPRKSRSIVLSRFACLPPRYLCSVLCFSVLFCSSFLAAVFTLFIYLFNFLLWNIFVIR